MGQVDNTTLVKALGGAFIARKDVKALQADDGSWRPARDYQTKEAIPFTMTDFNEHLAGTKTLGHYTVDQDGMTKIFCYDIDLRKFDHGEKSNHPTLMTSTGAELIDPRGVWESHREDPSDKNFAEWSAILQLQMRCLAEGLAYRIHRMTGLHVAIVQSGRKGLHVYGFCGLRPAAEVRALAHHILESMGCWVNSKGKNFFIHRDQYQCFEIEVFPKQEDTSDLGNLLALPLGLHRVTGERKTFCSIAVPMNVGWVEMSAQQALDGALPWDTGTAARRTKSASIDPSTEPGNGASPKPPASPAPKSRRAKKASDDIFSLNGQ